VIRSEERPDILRVEALRAGSEPDQVAEKHADDLALLVGILGSARRERRSAGVAEP
jgi:hypothetical protein